MGNNCSSIKTPQLRNKLSDDVGDIGRTFNDTSGFNAMSFQQASNPAYSSRTFWGFCAGLSDTSVRKAYCKSLGSGEWKYRSASNTCNFSSCNTGQYQSPGCCGWCCGIVGKGVTCSRESYNGDPIPCCLNDFAGCGINDGLRIATPNDPCKFNLGFSEDVNGNPINQYSVGNSICTESDTSSSFSYTGWSCLEQNCPKTCDSCLRSITTDGDTVLVGRTEDKIINERCGKMRKTGPYSPLNTFHGYDGCRGSLLRYLTGNDLPSGDTSWMYRWMDSTGAPLRYGGLNVMLRNIFDTSENTVYGYGTNGVSNYPTSDYFDPARIGCAIVQIYFDTITSGADTCTPFYLGAAIISSKGVTYSKLLLQLVVNRYIEDGYVLGAMPGDSSYNIFQDFLYSYIFCKLPFLAQDILRTNCAIYTTSDLERNPNIANLCGCQLPDGEYQKYVDQYGVNLECTPMCNRPGTIPIVNPENIPKICEQSICIINDVAIRLANATVTGTININNICNNCAVGSGASCSCRVSDSVLNLQGQVNNINTGAVCTSLLCTVVNPDTGKVVTIDCDKIDQSASILEQRKKEEEARRQEAIRKRNRNLLILVFILLIAICIIGVIVGPSFYDPKEKTIQRKQEVPLKPFGYQVGSINFDGKTSGEFMSDRPRENLKEFGYGVGVKQVSI